MREATNDCKLHDNVHPYVRHAACGHEYCPHYWMACPRCQGSHEGNRVQDGRRASEYGNDEIRWPDGLQNY